MSIPKAEARQVVERVLGDLGLVLAAKVPADEKYAAFSDLYAAYDLTHRKAMTEAMMARLAGATI